MPFIIISGMGLFMKIDEIVVHNFRGISDATISLCNYTLLMGPNNGGKSTAVDALRAFYEKDGYKFKSERDTPFNSAGDGESWVEIIFSLNDPEADSLKVEYLLADNQLRLRKYFQTREKTHDNKSANGSIFGYTAEGDISKDLFYGAKNVQTGKIGDLVFIPAVSKVDDHTKLSGPSVLRDLLTSVLSGVVESSTEFEDFNKSFEQFATGVKTEETSDGRSLSGLESEVNDMLTTWSTELKLRLVAPSTTDIIKSMLGFDFFEEGHEHPMSAEQFGSGFQRHFIYTLIQVGARYAGTKQSKKSKEFSPSMTMILFEEPEAFLHPSQQDILARSLMKLSEGENWQVLCTTHSPHFVSKNAANIPSLVRLRRDNASIQAFQINDRDWNEIVDSNQALNKIARRHPKMAKRLRDDDMTPEMEAVKHFLWLNSDRCAMFFANHILLVEGQTEVALINKLVADDRIASGDCGLYILDCLGKYNIHRFMNLASALGIRHSCSGSGETGLSG